MHCPASSSSGCIGCKLQAVGFDMDYTLSQYRPETFELLAYTLTVQKLVEAFGYPEVRCFSSLLAALYYRTGTKPLTVATMQHLSVFNAVMRI